MGDGMRIFLDMDGTITNFIGHFLRWFEIEGYHHNDISYYDHCFEIAPLTKSYYWDEMDDVNFWFRIDPYPWFMGLIDIIRKYDRDYTVLTSMHPNRGKAIKGKYLWLKKYLPLVIENGRYAFAINKQWFAHQDAVLIDDYEEHIDNFIWKGGKGILWPMPWNRRRDLYPVKNVEKFIKEEIEK
jgi:5'(3')-deoxyribonucleotidase